MPQEFPDDRKPKASSRANRRKRVSQIVQPNALEPRTPTDSEPRLLEIRARPVSSVSANDERGNARVLLKDL